MSLVIQDYGSSWSLSQTGPAKSEEEQKHIDDVFRAVSLAHQDAMAAWYEKQQLLKEQKQRAKKKQTEQEKKEQLQLEQADATRDAYFREERERAERQKKLDKNLAKKK
jgi:hypothetical protein